MTLKDLRAKAKLTQEDLAMHSGVSVRTIQRIENHKQLLTDTTLETAVRLTRALGISIEELTGKVMETEEKIYFENDFRW